MASFEESDASAFPAADLDKEFNPGNNTEFEVDSTSAQVAKDRDHHVSEKKSGSTNANANPNANANANASKKNKQDKKDAMESLKSAIIVSAVVVAVVGAVYAISKKLKEN